MAKSLEEDKSITTFVWNGKKYFETKESLEPSRINITDVRDTLVHTASKYAYWSTLLADLLFEMASLTTKYDLWYARVYSLIESRIVKKGNITEGYKQNQIYLQYKDDVKRYFEKKNELQRIINIVSGLVKSFDIQSRTLQTVSGIMKAELGMVKGGVGNLDD